MTENAENPTSTTAPGVYEVTAKDTKSGNSATVTYDFRPTLEDAVAAFGEDVVYSLYQSAAQIRLQNAMRGVLSKGGTINEATKLASEWKPGIQRRGGGRPKKDPIDALMEKVAAGEITPSELKKILAERLKALDAK